MKMSPMLLLCSHPRKRRTRPVRHHDPVDGPKSRRRLVKDEICGRGKGESTHGCWLRWALRLSWNKRREPNRGQARRLVGNGGRPAWGAYVERMRRLKQRAWAINKPTGFKEEGNAPQMKKVLLQAKTGRIHGNTLRNSKDIPWRQLQKGQENTERDSRVIGSHQRGNRNRGKRRHRGKRDPTGEESEVDQEATRTQKERGKAEESFGWTEVGYS